MRTRYQERFPAMGSEAHVIVVGGAPSLVATARARVDELEARWSRFRSASDVSRANAAAGSPMRVSDDTLLLFERALDARRLTAGAFDPLVLTDVIAAGYDRSFEHLAVSGDSVQTRARGPRAAPAIDRTRGTVTVPAGTGFDPGGIGKGLAADLIVELLMDHGARGASVALGGDLRVAGDPGHDDGWQIEVTHPRDDRPIARLAVADGAVATTSPVRRRWLGPAGDERHHLIDPATGRTAHRGIAAVTVVAAEGWLAEAAAKAAYLAGPLAIPMLEDLGVAGLVLGATGSIRPSEGIEGFLR